MSIIWNSQEASRAAQNALAGHIWPARHVFETPGLKKLCIALRYFKVILQAYWK